MNIRTQYYLGACVSAVTMLAITAMFVVSSERLNHAVERSKLAADILVGFSEMRFLRSEYVLHRHARPREQWQRRHASVAALLARDSFEGTGQQQVISGLRRRHQELEKLFSALAQDYAALENGAAEGELSREREARLIGQLNEHSQELISGTTRIQRESDAELVATGRWSNLLDVLAIGIMGLIVTVNACFGIRCVLNPLGRLRRGIELIGKGDLSHRTGIIGDNEIGALSQAFDRMTASLQASRVTVEENTKRLMELNDELESFSYSVSHDLRAPLRAIDGFGQRLLDSCRDKLDASAVHYLDRIRAGTQIMAQLIEDLLNLSRISRSQMNIRPVDLGALAQRVANELQQSEPQRSVEFAVTGDASVRGDERLLEIALRNLLGNAWKFTSKRERARIEFGTTQRHGATVYFVRDNGAGFDMAYADKLFAPFQRLHSATEFPGTGIGLVTVRRILQRHDGRIWVEAALDEGAAFFFTVGKGAEDGGKTDFAG